LYARRSRLGLLFLQVELLRQFVHDLGALGLGEEGQDLHGHARTDAGDLLERGLVRRPQILEGAEVPG
jgi:hypothetical protein